YRLDTARNVLRILRSGTNAGLALHEEDAMLADGTLQDQIAWFEDFDAWQQALFLRQIGAEAERLKGAGDARAVALGRRIEQAIVRAGGSVIQLLGELAGYADDLTAFAGGLSEGIRKGLAAPGNQFLRADPGFIDALVAVAAELQRQGGDLPDAEDDDAD